MTHTEPSQEIWSAVDALACAWMHAPDPALADALAASDGAGLPRIQVSECQGKFLYLLTSIRAAGRVLEIGTLGGYSTIWMARALRHGGELVTLEIDPLHARVATENIARAGLADRVSVRVGPALDLLPAIHAERGAPFDLVFIDADKENSPRYVEWALRLCAPGCIIVVDNIVRRGAVLQEDDRDERVRGCREAMRLLGSSPRVRSTVLQTVGAKGYDGFAVALVD